MVKEAHRSFHVMVYDEERREGRVQIIVYRSTKYDAHSKICGTHFYQISPLHSLPQFTEGVSKNVGPWFCADNIMHELHASLIRLPPIIYAAEPRSGSCRHWVLIWQCGSLLDFFGSKCVSKQVNGIYAVTESNELIFSDLYYALLCLSSLAC